jgi:hypothetical protein
MFRDTRNFGIPRWTRDVGDLKPRKDWLTRILDRKGRPFLDRRALILVSLPRLRRFSEVSVFLPVYFFGILFF